MGVTNGVEQGWFRVAVVCALLSPPGLGCLEKEPEQYQYVSRPRGSDAVSERGEVEIRNGEGGFRYRSVPAGPFDCYDLELTLRVFLFRPRVSFWVSRQEPHRLVRQEGKRSALGPVFVTELQAVR